MGGAVVTPAKPFNPADALVVIHTWPRGHASVRLMTWLWANGFQVGSLRLTCGRPIECAYNHGIRMAINSHRDWIVFADNDMLPGPPLPGEFDPTEPFLRDDEGCLADLVACQYPTVNDATWGDPRQFHTGLYRVRRDLLMRLAPPYFYRELTPDGLQVAACVCTTFVDKVLAAGGVVRRAGWAEHKVTRTG